jgi:hypothetical protein
MSDGSFVIISQGKTIYRGGNNKEDKSSRRSRRSVRNDGTIIYPIFKEAIRYAEGDLFWIKILEDASEGVFPRTHRYRDGILSCKKKNKYFSKEISQDDPALCLENVQDFMKDNGFYSSRDNALKVEEINNLREKESMKEITWSGIRSNKTKKVLISGYISYLVSKYALSNIEQSDLINKIRLANSSGLINKETVVMENKQIINITVLCYDAKHRDFFIDPGSKLPKVKSEKKKKEDEDIIETPSTKSCGISISKSRVTDWNKFSIALGKRLSGHNYSTYEEPESPVRIKKKRIIIASSTE